MRFVVERHIGFWRGRTLVTRTTIEPDMVSSSMAPRPGSWEGLHEKLLELRELNTPLCALLRTEQDVLRKRRGSSNFPRMFCEGSGAAPTLVPTLPSSSSVVAPPRSGPSPAWGDRAQPQGAPH